MRLASVQVVGAALNLGRILVKVNETNVKAEDLLSRAMTTAQGTSARPTAPLLQHTSALKAPCNINRSVLGILPLQV